jgi:hypothetical protein
VSCIAMQGQCWLCGSSRRLKLEFSAAARSEWRARVAGRRPHHDGAPHHNNTRIAVQPHPAAVGRVAPAPVAHSARSCLATLRGPQAPPRSARLVRSPSRARGPWQRATATSGRAMPATSAPASRTEAELKWLMREREKTDEQVLEPNGLERPVPYTCTDTALLTAPGGRIPAQTSALGWMK